VNTGQSNQRAGDSAIKEQYPNGLAVETDCCRKLHRDLGLSQIDYELESVVSPRHAA